MAVSYTAEATSNDRPRIQTWFVVPATFQGHSVGKNTRAISFDVFGTQLNNKILRVHFGNTRHATPPPVP
jgi:hypothetical protein